MAWIWRLSIESAGVAKSSFCISLNMLCVKVLMCFKNLIGLDFRKVCPVRFSSVGAEATW